MESFITDKEKLTLFDQVILLFEKYYESVVQSLLDVKGLTLDIPKLNVVSRFRYLKGFYLVEDQMKLFLANVDLCNYQTSNKEYKKVLEKESKHDNIVKKIFSRLSLKNNFMRIVQFISTIGLLIRKKRIFEKDGSRQSNPFDNHNNSIQDSFINSDNSYISTYMGSQLVDEVNFSQQTINARNNQINNEVFTESDQSYISNTQEELIYLDAHEEYNQLFDTNNSSYLENKDFNKRDHQLFSSDFLNPTSKDILNRVKNFCFCSKREIFYSNVEIYQSMENVDRTLSDICYFFMIPRTFIPVFPSAKGEFFTNITLLNNKGKSISIENQISLISQDLIMEDFLIDVDYFNEMESNIYGEIQYSEKKLSSHRGILDFILILEKDTVFRNVINDKNFLQSFENYCVITGKGYPDYLTRMFIKKLEEETNKLRFSLGLDHVRLLYFGDWDCYGVEIYMIYCFGSRQSCLDNEYLALIGLTWIGVFSEYLSNEDFVLAEKEQSELNIDKTLLVEDSSKSDETQDSEINYIESKANNEGVSLWKNKIKVLLMHPGFNTDSWILAICDHSINKNLSEEEISGFNKMEHTIKSMQLLKRELEKMLFISKKAESEAIIQNKAEILIKSILSNLIL